MKRFMVVFLITLIAVIMGLYLFSNLSSNSEGGNYKYAYVVSSLAETADPKYGEYEAAKLAYENKKAQYEAEGHVRTWRMNQTERDHISQDAFERSLEAVFVSKMAVKASENEAKLMAEYNLYLHKYADVWGLNPSELDLRIVNLQLRIYSLSPYVKNHDDVKKGLEKELQMLLEGRDASLALNDTRLRNKVLEAVTPLKEKLESDIENYKFEVDRALSEEQYRQRRFGTNFNEEMGASTDEVTWRSNWEKELAEAKENCQKLHEEIQNRVKVVSERIASQKNLKLVTVDNAPVGESKDITRAVITALSKDKSQ